MLYFLTDSPDATPASVGAGAYIGIFEMCVPFVLWNKALRLTSHQYTINQMSYFAPFISLIFIASVLGEHISMFAIIGLVLIIGGVIYNSHK